MTFVFRLAENLGMTVRKLVTGVDEPMSALEFEGWKDYRQKVGFVADRIEWAVANGASAQCHAWGAKVKPDDVIPRFGRPKLGKRSLLTSLANLPGEFFFIPKDPNRPTLEGAAAMAEIDRVEEGKRKPKLISDGSGKIERPNRPRTLGGD